MSQTNLIRLIREKIKGIVARSTPLKAFPGQTEENAIIRATPIVKEIQARTKAVDDLLD